jgi:hypothetical protein
MKVVGVGEEAVAALYLGFDFMLVKTFNQEI